MKTKVKLVMVPMVLFMLGLTTVQAEDMGVNSITNMERSMSNDELKQLSNKKAKEAKTSLFAGAKSAPEKKDTSMVVRKFKKIELGDLE